MNHQDALREMSVERYLLGELTGDARDVFEEHLFDCMECTQDLKTGLTFIEAQQRVGIAPIPVKMPMVQSPSRPRRWLLNPVWLTLGLAACMAIVLYQSLYQIPRMKEQLAQANAPQILNSLVLAGGAARGGESRKIVAQGGYFLVGVDIPPIGNYSKYLCSLISPSGKSVWSHEVTLEQAKDTVQIQFPVSLTDPGENTLLIQGIKADGSGNNMETVTTEKFFLEVHQ